MTKHEDILNEFFKQSLHYKLEWMSSNVFDQPRWIQPKPLWTTIMHDERRHTTLNRQRTPLQANKRSIAYPKNASLPHTTTKTSLWREPAAASWHSKKQPSTLPHQHQKMHTTGHTIFAHNNALHQSKTGWPIYKNWHEVVTIQSTKHIIQVHCKLDTALQSVMWIKS